MRHQKSFTQYHLLLNELNETLSCSKSDFTEQIEKGYPLNAQIVGNCIFSSLEQVIWGLIALYQAHQKDEKPLKQKIQMGTALFKLFQLHTKLWVASKYFDAHLKEGNPYFPDMSLSSKMMDHLKNYKIDVNHPFSLLYNQALEKHKELTISFRPTKDSPKKESISKATSSSHFDYNTLRSQYYP